MTHICKTCGDCFRGKHLDSKYCSRKCYHASTVGKVFKPLDDAFFSKVEMIPLLGCWLWTGALSTKGYGSIRRDGRTRTASVLSYQMHRGEIPFGLCVLHRCDIPSCVNPEHLFLGTQKENVEDRDRKGRGAPGLRGEMHPSAKLTAEDVAKIRSSAESSVALGRLYGVSKTQILRIRKNITWHTRQDDVPANVSRSFSRGL